MFLLNENTLVLVQGITGTQGRFHTKAMLDYGTKIVAGVTPGKGGTSLMNIPIYNSVKEAVESHPEINTTILFVPAKFCKNAALEAINNQIPLMIIITEGIPLLDSLEIINYASEKNIYVIGPNSPGIISPKYKCKVGIMPSHFFPSGNVGICSRSGTLSYEIALSVKYSNRGISTAIGIGGDPLIGPTFTDVLEKFENDDDTELIILIGEIGGGLEEASAEHIKKLSKPVIGFIAGRTINVKGKRFGHAGALITSGGEGTAQHKIDILESVGVKIAKYPTEIKNIIKRYK
ncbi:MAG: succinate--CoA ligase subunit alpha [Candidatus Helarchaeota archaeon]|nr:succinate--CoA ligase subunit alpha [Candidatus Helarchaeota archaeon]